jgi:O-antigen ligase
MYGIILYSAKESKWKKWYLTAIAVTLAIITLLTGSRKALMMVVIFTAAYVFLWVPERSMARFFGRLLAIGCAVFGLVFLLMKVPVLYNAIGNRLESLYLQWAEGGDVDSSAVTRQKMISIGIELIKMEPLIGHGHNTFKFVSGYLTYSHNNYIELLVSLGVCGLLVYYLPVLYFTIQAFNLWRKGVPGAILPLTILVMQLINDIGQVSYYSFYIHIFLGIAVGYVYLLKKQYRHLLHAIPEPGEAYYEWIRSKQAPKLSESEQP